MNLAVRGISYDLGTHASSTFTDDQHKDKKVDYIMANPPFNLKKWRTADTLLDDVRWKGYAVPPESNANYAWILHMLNKLEVTKGVAGFLLANGALDDSDTLEIRKKLLQNDKVISKDVFVFSGMQTGRDICIRIGLYNGDEPALMSPAYTTFTVKDDKKLIPEFLFLCFNNNEMDRYGWFISDSSVRSNLDWNRFLEIKIPIPSPEKQRAIVNIYNCAKAAKDIANKTDQLIKDICPALMRQVIGKA